MKKYTNFLLILVVIFEIMLISGCATTMTPVGIQSGLWTGNKVPMYDPSQKVDPSQTANKGADGHAAALALGDIQNPEARTDAKEAMIAISENNSFWGRGSGAIGIGGQVPALAGQNGGFGRLYNPFEYPIRVIIRGLGSAYTFGPGEEQELLVPQGKYDVIVYNAESGQLIGHDTLDTSRRMKTGDKIYDFNIRLDGVDIH
ncbi:hypothetical protein GW933_03830 [Candidatus Falkowbacteria bacterium]|uniref:Uncharacterized protein n=1 Tax=Candidatus Buchananbacteria bacterium CG10_big_fil_rev_8_21_14_0_10_33_19 TaxID=1974525 RepID=A0A2H0W5A1_9BACT|nr:hypothetical protein [Candidatus Falkowbacteria bacterium]PIS06529.1 MAG: hypothetical protein COT80_00195 [Candidatus Buchananbacteria bacterium CG10_big_fil_rev_8_21_14_0_10_33_19]